jgi:DNA end-binding protein Ku
MATPVWKGHLSFGLVSIPVKLYRAARADKVEFRQVHEATGSRVRQALYREPVQSEGRNSPQLARSVAHFASLRSLSRYFETSYYVAPDRACERAYALLLRALGASGLVGIAQVAIRREHVVVLRPGASKPTGERSVTSKKKSREK